MKLLAPYCDGHGNKGLSNMLLTLNLIAFALHAACEPGERPATSVGGERASSLPSTPSPPVSTSTAGIPCSRRSSATEHAQRTGTMIPQPLLQSGAETAPSLNPNHYRM